MVQPKQDQHNKFQPSKSEIFSEFDSFRLLISASSNSGKSHLIKQLLLDPSLGIRDKFPINNVFIFNPSKDIDQSWIDIIKNLNSRSTKEVQFNENEQVFHKDLEQSLQTVYNQLCEESIQAKFTKEKQKPSLIILDDCLLEINMSSNHSFLGKILVKCRHHKISVIVSSQYLKALHPLTRSQFSHYITFQTSNAKEIAKIREECASTLSAKQFLDLYNFCVGGERYSYMLVIFSFPVKYKFFKGNGSNIEQLQM